MSLLKIWDIEININRFFLLLILIYLSVGVFFQAMMVFALVLFHELMHMRAALKCGLKVAQIELYPFGGVARLEGLLAADPVKEIKVALAGPLSNLMLALGALFLNSLIELHPYWFLFFCKINITLGLVNLLPALPLDGGRITRALLAGRIGIKQATLKMAYWGQLFSIAIALISIIGVAWGIININGIILAVFLFLAAREEGDLSTFLFIRYLSKKHLELTKEGIMKSGILAVTPQTKLGQVVEKLLPRRYHLVVVVGPDGSVQHLFSEGEIIDGVLSRGASLPVGDL